MAGMQRTGIGYDVHPFEPGRRLVLGGVEIPHELGLKGHSDADVLCHAIADAILGAVGERDIGHHFPNTDESLAGISSLEILRRVHTRLLGLGAALINIDSTLIAEAPKIGPHIFEMRMRIADALSIAPGCVGIKATTNEGLGFVGRSEGIAAIAVASVVASGLPSDLDFTMMIA